MTKMKVSREPLKEEESYRWALGEPEPNAKSDIPDFKMSIEEACDCECHTQPEMNWTHIAPCCKNGIKFKE